MDLSPLKLLVEADMSRVDRLIESSLQSSVPLIPQLSKHLIQSGGKRLRPLITLLSAAAFQYQGEGHLIIAATLELIHTATLLHDDVIDASTLRRGKKTANALWDNSASILVGDFLYSRAFQLMVRINNQQALKILAEATNTLSQSEILQLINCHNPALNENEYLEIITGKTGILFSIAAQLPAILANRTEKEATAIKAYGLHLGIAFQLADDALDYIGSTSEIGKTKGDDLAEGKMTLPLIYALQHATSSQKLLIREAILQGDRAAFDDILAILQDTQAIEYTYQCAKDHVTKAKNILSTVLAHSPYREALNSLAEFAELRKH